MKRNLLAVLAFAAVATVFTNCKKEEEKTGSEPTVEFLASMEVENKHAVLEDFTGVRCGFCPDGHAIAQSLIEQYGEKMIVVGVNAGGYAAPASGWANFTTPYGNALIAQSSVAGYPAGTVNRVQYGNGQKGGLAMSRGSWAAAAQARMAEVSPVNIGAKATFDAASRELTVKVDVYYTGEGNGANMLNIGLLQSGMVAKQSGGSANYVHKHVLRDFITGQWGDEIPAESTKTGSKYTKTFTYTVPADYNGATIPPGGGEAMVEDMEVVIYIAENHTNIYTGIKTDIEIK